MGVEEIRKVAKEEVLFFSHRVGVVGDHTSSPSTGFTKDHTDDRGIFSSVDDMGVPSDDGRISSGGSVFWSVLPLVGYGVTRVGATVQPYRTQDPVWDFDVWGQKDVTRTTPPPQGRDPKHDKGVGTVTDPQDDTR